ncbi:hypothetical protein V8D89_012290 [Ganoderma adspersum]
MIPNLIVPLLTTTGALFARAFAESTPGYSDGLTHNVDADQGRLASHAFERRAGPVPHVASANIVLEPDGGGYPRVTSLSDGTLLASYTAYGGDNRTLDVMRSTDGGKKFGPWGTVAHWHETGNLDNFTFLLQLRDGRVVAAYRNHELDADREATRYRLTASYYSTENSATDQDILLQTSTDNAATWSAPSTISGGTTTGRDGMPCCANFNDWSEKLMCVFKTTEGSPGLKSFSINDKSVVSTDDGKTWGTRSQVFKPSANGKNGNALPQIVALPDGNLVVSFMTDEDTTLKDNHTLKIVMGPPVATGDWGQKTTVTRPQSESDGSVLGCAGASAGLICKDIMFTAN